MGILGPGDYRTTASALRVLGLVTAGTDISGRGNQFQWSLNVSDLKLKDFCYLPRGLLPPAQHFHLPVEADRCTLMSKADGKGNLRAAHWTPFPHSVSLPRVPDLSAPSRSGSEPVFTPLNFEEGCRLWSGMWPVILTLPWPLVEALPFLILFPQLLSHRLKHWPQVGKTMQSSSPPWLCCSHL